MFDVLLVDDEPIVLDGISRLVPWEAHQTRLVGTSNNGFSACESILRLHPDIVICDIKMPMMDGLDLITKCKTMNDGPMFIILSGYDEFEFAKRAMELGVRHYLLKPCNEKEIGRVLHQVVEELDTKRKEDVKHRQVEQQIGTVMPKIAERLLIESITTNVLDEPMWHYYNELFDLQLVHQSIRLLMFDVEGEKSDRQLFEARDLIEDVVCEQLKVHLAVVIGEYVVVVVEDDLDNRLLDVVGRCQSLLEKVAQATVTAAISDGGQIEALRSLYRDTFDSLSKRLVLEAGAIIASRESNEKCQGNEVVRQMMEFVEQNLSNSEISLTYLAKHQLFMNAEYLGKLFREKTGVRFSDYLMNRRIEQAKMMIRRSIDVKVSEIAEEVGFGGNAQYFSHVFKKVTGYTPSTFKKLHV